MKKMMIVLMVIAVGFSFFSCANPTGPSLDPFTASASKSSVGEHETLEITGNEVIDTVTSNDSGVYVDGTTVSFLSDTVSADSEVTVTVTSAESGSTVDITFTVEDTLDDRLVGTWYTDSDKTTEKFTFNNDGTMSGDYDNCFWKVNDSNIYIVEDRNEQYSNYYIDNNQLNAKQGAMSVTYYK